MSEVSPESIIPAEKLTSGEATRSERPPVPVQENNRQAIADLRQGLARVEDQILAQPEPKPPFSSKDFGEGYFQGKDSNYHNYDIYDNDGFWRSVTDLTERESLGGEALDVGCAYGYLLERLSPRFDQVTGLDISRYALQKAKKVAPSATLVQADISQGNLPFPENHFDLITALDVLEHTPSVKESLKRLVRVLKENRTMIVEIPLRDTLMGRLKKRFGLERDITHISVPTEKEFLEAVAAAGLEVKERDYFLHWPKSKPKMPRFLARLGVRVFNNLEVILQKKKGESQKKSS